MKKLIIEKKLIKQNLQAAKTRAGGAEIIADLSCDAVGLGLVETALLLRDEGVRIFAVSDPKDAAILRRNGFTEQQIMMLRSTADPVELKELVDLGVTCTVGSYESAVALNGIAEARKTVAEVQIKVDTGLGRYGFRPEEIDKIASIYRYMSNLAVVGIFTTFSDSKKNRKATETQLKEFEDVLKKLISMGYETGLTHACDSAALFRYDFGRLGAVRVDTALSGRVMQKNVPGLAKVGYISASLEEVAWYPKGHPINGTKKLRRPKKLAVISVGFANGFSVVRQDDDRGLLSMIKNRVRAKYVRVGTQKAKVIGKVGMMHTVIDVTDIPCTVGDQAIMDVDPITVKGVERVYKNELPKKK